MTHKTVLITGGTGFLGSHLACFFLERGYTVVVLKRSTSDIWRLEDVKSEIQFYDIDSISLDDIFLKAKIDTVIHTACCYGRNQESISEIVDVNVLFGLRLFEAARKNNVQCFINIDSLLPRQISNYSLSKSQFREWLEFVPGELKVVNMQIEHMYGPKDDTKKFVQRLLMQLRDNVPLIPLTSGIQQRDFVYITDVVSAIVQVTEKKDDLEHFTNFEVGYGVSCAVKDFVDELVSQYRKLHSENSSILDFGAVPYRIGEMMTVSVNISKLMQIGWQPEVSYVKGIQKILEM